MTTGLNTKTTDLIDLLTATNDKLDAIIMLLGGVPPTPTATIDDLFSVLTDIHTDTSSIDGKLLTIRDAITDNLLPVLTDIHTDTSSMDGKLLTIRDAITDDIITLLTSIGGDTTNIDGKLLTIRDAITDDMLPALLSIYTVLNYSFTNFGLNTSEASTDYNGYLFDSLNWLGLISGSTGLPIEGGNRDVIQLLAKIADRPESQIGSGLAPPDLCEDAYISSSMVLLPAFSESLPAVVFAIFPDPPPSGISFGTTLSLGVFNMELENSGDWAGWGIYVASNAPNFGLQITLDTDAFLRYPTNVWVDIGFLSSNLAVYVGGGDSLRVYLCSGSWGGPSSSGGPWGDGSSSGGEIDDGCVTINSTVVSYATDGTGSSIVWPEPLESVAITPVGYYADANVWCVTDLYGYTITPSVDVNWFSDFHYYSTTISAGVPFLVTGHTDHASIHIFPSTASFSIELCPPA